MIYDRTPPKIEWLPEFLKNYLDWASETEPSPLHHIGSAFALLSATSPLVYIEYGNKQISPNLFVGLVAPSGYRKSESIRLAMQVYNRAMSKEPIMIKEPLIDSGSNVALLKLADISRTTLRIRNTEGIEKTLMFVASSEFASFMRTKDKDMVRLLTTLFDGAVVNDRFIYETQTGGRFEVLHPYFVMLVASTPEWLIESLPRTAREGGFTNRFLFFYSEQYKVKAFPQNSPVYEQKLETLADELVEIAQKQIPITWSAEARDLFKEWYEGTKGGLEIEILPSMRSWATRLGIFIIKLAGLSARADHRTIIKPEDLHFAGQLMKYARRGTLESLRSLDTLLELQIAKLVLQLKSVNPVLLATKLQLDADKVAKILRNLEEIGVLQLRNRVAVKTDQTEEFVKFGSLKYDLSWDELQI